MAGPGVIVDLDKVERNARAIAELCGEHGISLTAVTKVTCGMPQVARALIRGGAEGIGESRLENIHRLRANGIVEEMMLLRIPPLSGAEEIVRTVDISLNSELSVIRALSEAASSHGIIHEVILMIDLGDLREGFWPDDVVPAAREIVELPNIRLKGVGTNLTCYGGVVPTEENMRQLVDWAKKIEDVCGLGIELISGGNSSSLPLLASGKMPKEVNHLRIGEGILLGRETIDRTPWPGTVQDAFRIEAEIIELKQKPSVPIGRTGQDAFGHTPEFEDKGERMRAILNIGREDVDVDGLSPVDEEKTIIGASSDHLLIDVGPAGQNRHEQKYHEKKYQEHKYDGGFEDPVERRAGDESEKAAGTRRKLPILGESLEFIPNYSALLAAMTSSYVEKRTVGGPDREMRSKRLLFFGSALSTEPDSAFVRTLSSIGYEVESASDVAIGDSLEGCLHSACMPVICGRKQRTAEGFFAFSEAVGEAGLLWLSPYASIRDTYSGGDALGELLRAGEKELHAGRHERNTPRRAPAADNLVLVGLREVDEDEAEIIHRLGITVFTMEDVDRLGIQDVMRKALARAVIGTKGLYIYYDERLSDTGQEGLTTRETHMMMELLSRTGFMRVLDVSGVHLGSRARRKLQQFVSSALGKRILR